MIVNETNSLPPAEMPVRPTPAYPNLRHLRLLEAAERMGSLTAAAETIHISQPAASQAVNRLASQFGGRLLERQGNGVYATERGKLVIVRARRVQELIRLFSHTTVRRPRADRQGWSALLESHLTISHLRSMSYVGQTGSFSAAARALNQAEPSVQRAAREVEGITGLQLFAGGLRKIQLTPAGLAFARTSSLILKELESAFDEVREYEGAFDGRIIIGTLPLVRTKIVPDAVVSISRKYPKATIGILDGTYEDLTNGLETGSIDVLIGALREPFVHSSLVQELLFHDKLAIVAGADHPLASKADVSDEELKRYRWVLPRPGTPTRQLFDKLVKSRELPDDTVGVVETGSLVALRGILLSSDYLTIISPRQIVFELEAGLLKRLPVSLTGSSRPIGMTTRKDWQPTKLQQDFIADLKLAVAAAQGNDWS